MNPNTDRKLKPHLMYDFYETCLAINHFKLDLFCTDNSISMIVLIFGPKHLSLMQNYFGLQKPHKTIEMAINLQDFFFLLWCGACSLVRNGLRCVCSIHQHFAFQVALNVVDVLSIWFSFC